MDAVITCSIVLVLLSAPVWGIALKRAITRLFIRHLEKKTFDPKWIAGNQHRRQQHGDGPRVFPLATASGFGIAALVFALSFTPGLESDAPVTIGPVFLYGSYAACASLVAAAFYLHHSSRASRRLKYDLVLTAAVWAASLWQVQITVGLSFPSADVPAAVFAGMLRMEAGRLFLGCLTFVGIQVVASSIRKRIRTHQSAVVAFYDLQAPALWALAFLLTPLLVAYVVFRYHLLEKVAAHPILYFRSFRYQDAPTVFAKIIAPATRRFGVVEGLVHATQRSSDLQGSMDVNVQAHFSTSADENWQSWVTGKLRSASAVIIDAAGATNNLAWEIDQALAVVGPERVAILVRPGTEVAVPEGVFRCEYALDRPSVRRATTTLGLWLRSVLFARRATSAESVLAPS